MTEKFEAGRINTLSMKTVITHSDQLNFKLDDVKSMPLPDRALMVSPDFFDVRYVINPHMEGNIGAVDKKKAQTQWEQIKSVFNGIGLPVTVIPGVEGFPDMVFCANQSLPYIDSGMRKHVLMSIMHSEHRRGEVPYMEQWYRINGYKIHYLPDSVPDFEGMGDAIWHSGKSLLWGGYGYRSSPDAYAYISETFEVPVITVELTHPSFYHLDTCFSSIDAETALIYPPAFTSEGLALIRKLIPNVLEAPSREAEELFACNATCPDGKNVLIQKGCPATNSQLKKAGFAVHEVETGEYLKSGGSVFCMKMLAW